MRKESNTRVSSFLVGRSMCRRTLNSYVYGEAYQDLLCGVVVVASGRWTA